MLENTTNLHIEGELKQALFWTSLTFCINNNIKFDEIWLLQSYIPELGLSLYKEKGLYILVLGIISHRNYSEVNLKANP